MDTEFDSGFADDLASAMKDVPRDDQGRFTAAQEQTTVEIPEVQPDAGQAGETSEVKPPETGDQVTPNPDQQTQDQTGAIDRPPSSWSAMGKARWASLDPEVRKEVLKREDDFHKGIAPYRESHQVATTLHQMVAPYVPSLQSRGMNPLQAINGLLQIDYEFQRDPRATLLKLAQSAGITDFGTPPVVDPQADVMQRRLQQLEAAFQNQQAAAQRQIVEGATAEITRFAADPKNIYFEDVKQDMAALLQSGRASDLKDAYDKAVWMNPQTRAALSAQQQTAATQQHIDKARQTADAKKRAGFDVKGNGSVNPGRKGMSIEDALRAQLMDS